MVDYDVDGDGIPELTLQNEFSMVAAEDRVHLVYYYIPNPNPVQDELERLLIDDQVIGVRVHRVRVVE